MNSPLLQFTEQLIFSLKSGRSLAQTLRELEEIDQKFFSTIDPSGPMETTQDSSMTYELVLILKRGLEGLPIIKSLESFHTRVYEKIDQLIEDHSKKAPFKALVPLFIFQVPGLCLIFFYPLISEFLSEAT